ncbi:ribosomal protein S18-alanine N-acetyltransferase [Candidatus Borrarchaeum sp.]|uniref:ribosomal protein S18-alanine N-acetyltransferase n=1 Tax=Candidatus Borrarchaeum sp. TaxID=2846742 RepID=UPI00257A7152|nr:ribosomal protein S18-alanine N-acetyltransferase [Candidatus Borrarchaeum sp.]
MNLLQNDKNEGAESAIKEEATIIIRPYTQKDLPSIYEIEKNCFSESERYTRQHLEMLGDFKRYFFLVAQENEGSSIIGYCIGVLKSSREGTVGHIISVAVHPNNRRLGIGLELINELITQLKNAGATSFRLEVKMTNKAAREMYRKLGFNYVHILRNYYGDGKDAIVMKMMGNNG